MREETDGSFQRTIALPASVDKDKISADLHNGVLEITAPIAATALPRKRNRKAFGHDFTSYAYDRPPDV